MQRKKALQDLIRTGEIKDSVFLVVKEYRNCTNDLPNPIKPSANDPNDLASEGQRTFCSPQQSLHGESSIGQDAPESFSRPSEYEELSEGEDEDENQYDGEEVSRSEDEGIDLVEEGCPLQREEVHDRENEIEIMALSTYVQGEPPAVELCLPMARHVPAVEDASALLK